MLIRFLHLTALFSGLGHCSPPQKPQKFFSSANCRDYTPPITQVARDTVPRPTDSAFVLVIRHLPKSLPSNSFRLFFALDRSYSTWARLSSRPLLLTATRSSPVLFPILGWVSATLLSWIEQRGKAPL